jgi:cysteinyl-tRNA synthetase
VSKLGRFKDIDTCISNALFNGCKNNNTINQDFSGSSKKYMMKFIKYIEDDFDTPHALDTLIDATRSETSIIALRNMLNIFGLRY